MGELHVFLFLVDISNNFLVLVFLIGCTHPCVSSVTIHPNTLVR